MSDSVDQDPVLRPSIPSLAWLTASLWVGLVVAQRAEWSAYRGEPDAVAAVAAVAAAAAVAAVLAVRFDRGAVALGLAGLCAGMLVGWLYWGDWRSDTLALVSAATTSHEVEVLGDEIVSPFGASSQCRLIGGPASGGFVAVHWPREVTAPPLGRRVRVIGEVKSPNADMNGERVARAGGVGTVRARDVRDDGWALSVRGLAGRLRLRSVGLMARVPGEAGALLAGVVVGDRRRLAGTQADVDFRTTGLTHLVAVSGSHLIVVAAIVGWLATALGAGRVWRSFVVTAVVGSYVVFSGVQASAVRAWVMALVAALAWASGRRSDGGSALAVAAAIVLVASPRSAFDLGFALSVSAVGGLVVFARFAEAWLASAGGRLWRALSSPVALTLTATVATMPIAVSTFGMVSLVSPLANVIAGPLVSIALVCGLSGLGVASVWEAGGQALLALASVPASAAVRAARFMAAWPAAAVPAGASAMNAAAVCVGVAAVVWAWWPRPSRVAARCATLALVGATLLVAIGPPSAPGGSIQILDVGQGDAILVRDGAHAVLVDAGPGTAALRAALARTGLRRLDAVVITHLHADHYGGLAALKGLIRVPIVLVPAGATSADSEALRVARSMVGTEGVREVAAGTTFGVGGLEVDVLWPRERVADAATNEASIVLRVREGAFAALLTGDAEGEVIAPLVGDGSVGDLSVLKVGHHGSADAVTSSQLAVLRPEFALISVGDGNRYGHPTSSMVRILAQAGSRVVRTDQCGDITVRIAPSGDYVVTTSRSVRRSGSFGDVRFVRGRPIVVCATLDITFELALSRIVHSMEPHVETALRVQARLPYLRRARPPPRPRARTAQTQRWGGRRSRFQLRDVRRRERRRRRYRRCVQHAAVCL